MCGIAGKLNFNSANRIEHTEITSMLASIAHRGPDGEGVHLDGPVGLGHCRLSIIDLSTGAQPMANEDQTVWIVFNGEIYNFQELRNRLIAAGHVFRSRSDTEVILHLYEELGPDCVSELRGMFAFAIWDSNRRRLFVARDRVGIKPLYYFQSDSSLWFASELKSIISDPDVPRNLDPSAIRRFLAFNYVPGEQTLFKGLQKLLPGHYLIAENGQLNIRRYWDLRFTEQRSKMSMEEAAEELRELLAATVKDHMIADVPVGILLSGGMDSSAVLSFAVQNTEKRIKTFTVGFDGNQVVDERPFARMAANRFGTEHFETSITAEDFWNFLPAYVRHMEEPICEPPAIALHYVSKLAKNHVKVLLSGEGGDEAFAGYPNYPNMLWLERVRSILGPLARPAGSVASLIGNLLGEERLKRYGAALGQPLASHYFSRTAGPTSFFNRNADKILDEDFKIRTASVSSSIFIGKLLEQVRGESLLNQMLYVDTKTWLPDDLLVKADKITMGNSLELRVPLLDHHVLEFGASLPTQFKVKQRETKRVLKAAFSKVIPEEILKRKKAGFPVPYEGWLRNELRSRVADVILSERAQTRGYFRPRELERLISLNANSGRYSKELFSLVILEMWHREFIDGDRPFRVPPRKADKK